MLAAAGLIAAVTLVARAFGFGRWLVFSRTVGTTCVGSLYQAANQLPNVVFEVAAAGAQRPLRASWPAMTRPRPTGQHRPCSPGH